MRSCSPRGEVLDAIHRFNQEHGHPPSLHDAADYGYLPSNQGACAALGVAVWADVIETAGYPRPTRGTNYRRKPLDETGMADGAPPPVSSSGDPEPPETVEGEGQTTSDVPRQPQTKAVAELPSAPPLDPEPSPHAQIAYHLAAALEHLAAACRTWGAAQ